MAKWDEITSTFKKGVSFVGNKSKEIVALTHLNNELGALQKEKTEKLTSLGAQVYQLILEGGLEAEELGETIGELSEIQQKIAAKKREIEEVRNTQQGKTADPEPEIEVIEAESCGHDIPEGAKFCPICGRRVD